MNRSYGPDLQLVINLKTATVNFPRPLGHGPKAARETRQSLRDRDCAAETGHADNALLLVPRHSGSDRLSVLRSRLGRASIAYSLGSQHQPCGASGQERILAQMQEGDTRKTRR